MILTIDKHAPYILLTNNQLKWRKKPWIDKNLQKLIALKHRLYKKYLTKRSDIFWSTRYKAVKKHLEKLLFIAKKAFFTTYFENNIANAKKLWRGINEIIHNKLNKNNAEIYLDDNGNILTDQKTVANRFNKFYSNVADNLLNKLGESPTKYQDYLRNPNEHSIFFTETDPGEVAKIILNLDASKSGDLYGITPRLIKMAPEMGTNLSIIFNIAIEKGVFPHLFKRAKVIPIHKGESKMIPSNYRPISLLPIFGKIFEKIIFARLTDFIQKFKIIYDKQYGFQRGKSTEYALLDIQNCILNSLERRENPCCVFLDFAKAFDTVNHKILLAKLNHYGIRGMPLQLIESYLTDREQCVQVNNATSDFEKVSHGVPQGSILGPLFFLLYINDIANSSPILSFYLFADDTAIFLSDKCIKNLEKTLNEELIKVSHWLIANKLSLNVKKSNALLFRTKNESSSPKINLQLNGSPIEEKKFAKYLGIIMDHKFTYEEQTRQVRSKLIKGNAILSRVKHFIPQNLLVNTYNAHFHSHIDYGFALWGYAAQTHLDSILKQQKKAVRILNFVKYADRRQPSKPLFERSKVLPLDKNLLLTTGKILWKASNSVLCPSLSDLFKKRDGNNTFHTPSKRLDVSQDSVTYAGTMSWNAIPDNIRSAPSLQNFKQKYKKHLLSTL